MIYDNSLGSGPLDHRTTLDIDGVMVGVAVEQRLNRAPDAFVVCSPPGFSALSPDGLRTEDNAKGTIEFCSGSIS